MASATLKPTYIFNQYYIDLLKKIKNIAKKHRNQSQTAKKVLKSVKDNYQTYDKTSEEYLECFKTNCNGEYWSSYINLEEDKYDEWLKDDKNLTVEIYKNITLKDVSKLLRNNYMVHHYLTVFFIYTNEMKEEDISKILKFLQEREEVDLDDEANKIENENVCKILKRFLKEKRKHDEENKDKEDGDMPGMDSLKDTTIGKIAKEIIDDIDLTKIKQSINEEGDIFKAISKPDSGFGELFTNVSQKMSNKISSGELSQEAIFKDAMKFASLLPGMLGNGNGGGGAAAGGSGGGSSGGFDMEAMMSMMSMMNSMGGSGGGGMGGGGKRARTGVNNQALKNLMKKQQLKQKLNNK
jgi:hypothetical protein